MELLKSAKRRSRLSDILYVAFNLIFAAAVFGFTVAFTPPFFAYLLVLLSKWRVFAVRPRFWFANLQANMVDVLVGLSIVTLIWQSSESLSLQIFLAVLYGFWLLVIKPRSRRSWVVMQASISQFLAITALFSLSYLAYASVIVAIGWVIGYAAARHVLMYHDESEATLLSLVWGLVSAELAWLAYHSTTAYGVPDVLLIPQVALITAVLGFAVYSLYHNYLQNDGSPSLQGIGKRLLFSGLLLVLLIGREIATVIQTL